MIINHIASHSKGNKVIVSAEVMRRGAKKPKTIWYSFPQAFSSYLHLDGSAFLALFLLPCMRTGEDLHIDATVSPVLLDSTLQIMDLVMSWNVGFNRVKITTSSVKRSKTRHGMPACFFSLGVDSFYTYLKHNKGKDRIQNLIFVHGFDIDLTAKDLYHTALRRMQHIAKQEKLTVISVATNLKNITEDYLEWDWEHGGAMASIAILLGQQISTTYFAGSDSWIQRQKIMPYGTHPMLDGLWSTEFTKIVHDGNEATRIQKIVKVVSRSPLALSHLRVCNQNLLGVYNCSNCEKCLRTMIDLQIADALPRSLTFAHTIPLAKLAKIHNSDFETYYYFEDSLHELERQNRYEELQAAIRSSLSRSYHPSPISRLITYLSSLDKKYNDRRIFKFIFRQSAAQDRTLLFKLFVKLGLIR